MSRSHHKLRCAAWWGSWAGLFYRDNRELRRRSRHKRQRNLLRLDENADAYEECFWNTVIVNGEARLDYARDADEHRGCQCPLPLDECIEQHELEWRRFAANQNASVRVPVIPRAA